MNNIQQKPLALIIEDNDSLADIFTQAMKIAGFDIQTVADGLQAMEKLKSLTPAVIILDLYLPGVSGDKVLEYIHGESRLKDAKIVLTTFDSYLADKFQDECDYALLKPVSFGQLRDLGIKLREALPEG
jgi:CheY-like chemotaxis protein